MNEIYSELHPIIATVGEYNTAQVDLANLPTTFTYSTSDFAVHFTWSAVTGAIYYELRVGGTGWDDATFVGKTTSRGWDVNAIAAGVHTYRLKSITVAGNYSESCFDLSVTISAPSAPTGLITQVIDNNILLWWGEPVTHSFWIDHYNIYIDTNVAEGAVTEVFWTTTSSRFISRFENLAGYYTYKVEAVDSYGNIGASSTIEAYVNQPPDFTLFDEYDLNGTATMTNVLWNSPFFLCDVSTTRTPDNMIGLGYASPQDAVDASYAVILQPNTVDGNFYQEFDAGTLLTSLSVAVSWDEEIVPTCDDAEVSVDMRIKDLPGDPWSSWTSGATQFFEHFQYFQIRINIAGILASTDDFIKVSNVRAIIQIKREIDSNTIFCDATDVYDGDPGTGVELPGDTSLGHGSKTFVDIDSITAESVTTEPLTVIVDFVDIPEPVYFRLLCFDAAGRRVDGTICWKVRGATSVG
jgi:hypothetical protein